MKCPRCSGLVITQYGETHCLICAWYFNPPYVEPMREPYQRRTTCLNCSRLPEPGYTRCAACRQYQREYKVRSKRKVSA